MDDKMRWSNLAVFIVLATSSEPVSAEFCKWVDKNGVAHYAETCPENVDSSIVEIPEPPSREQLEEAEKRSKQYLAEKEARSKIRKQEAGKEAVQRQAAKEKTDAQRRHCTEALITLETLSRQRPVFYDDARQLHSLGSYFSDEYEGERTYIDDEKRLSATVQWQQVADENCLPTFSKFELTCDYWKNRLSDMKKPGSKTPADNIRKLEKSLRICR